MWGKREKQNTGAEYRENQWEIKAIITKQQNNGGTKQLSNQATNKKPRRNEPDGASRLTKKTSLYSDYWNVIFI